MSTNAGPFRSSRLERLPAEIRSEILHIVEFDALRTLVRSSPVLFRHYVQDRRRILEHHMIVSLGDVLFEAQTLLRSWPVRRDSSLIKSYVTRILPNYQHRRLAYKGSISAATLSDFDEDELFGMLTVYTEVMEPLLKRFFKWLSTRKDAPVDTCGREPRPSTSERARALRALYRFELCSSQFGKTRRALQGPVDIYGDAVVLDVFFDLFEPWEVEEINTIAEFAWYQYDKAADETGPPMNRKDLRLIEAGASDAKYEFRNVDNGPSNEILRRTARIAWALTRGLRPLQELLEDDYNVEVQALLRTVFKMPRCDLWRPAGVMGKANQRRHRRGNWSSWSAREDMMRDHRSMKFEGDVEGSCRPSRPPWGWAFVWNETYSNLFGDYIPSYFRQLGYVIWDASRFGQPDVQGKLRTKWLQTCGSQDAMVLVNQGN